MQKLKIAAAFIFGFTTTASFADVPTPDLGNIFVEVSAGNVEYSAKDDFINFNDGLSHALGARTTVGIDFKRNDSNKISAETFAAVLLAGEVKESITDATHGTYQGKGELSLTGTGVGLRFAKNWEDLYFFFKGGVFLWKAKADLSYSGEGIATGSLPVNSSESENGVGTYVGVGAEWFLNQHLYLGVDYSYYPIDLKGDDFRVGVTSASIGIYF